MTFGVICTVHIFSIIFFASVKSIKTSQLPIGPAEENCALLQKMTSLNFAFHRKNNATWVFGISLKFKSSSSRFFQVQMESYETCLQPKNCELLLYYNRFRCGINSCGLKDFIFAGSHKVRRKNKVFQPTLVK